MGIQLTLEQEQRIHAVVATGAHRSSQEALDAAVAAVEIAAKSGFDGTEEELELSIAEGLNSGQPVEADEAFWNQLTAETDQMVTEHSDIRVREN